MQSNTGYEQMLEVLNATKMQSQKLKDDNYKILTSHDGSRVMVDKDNPRTEVEITKI